MPGLSYAVGELAPSPVPGPSRIPWIEFSAEKELALLV